MPNEQNNTSGYTDLVTEQSIPGEYASDVPVSESLINWESEVLNPKSDLAVGEEFFTQEWSFREFADDFLILNDIVMSDVPTNAIQIESEGNVLIAETLRSKAPVVSSSGVQDVTVHLTLTFPQGQAQSVKLQRLMSELQYHPLVYIFNGKIRRSLGVSDPVTTTMFILESGTLRSDPEHVGSIILDLTLHYFNYRPFSHHFWYNTNLPWRNEPEAEVIDQELYLGDLSSYEASSYSLDYEAEKLARDLKAGATALSLENPNVPVNFPSASDAWMFYADYLSDITNSVYETNSDYVGFRMKAFEYHSPPGEAQSAGKGLIADLFKDEDGTFGGVAEIYNAMTQPVIGKEFKTASTTAAERASAPEYDGEPLATGHDWLQARMSLVSEEAGGMTPWTGPGRLQLVTHLSPDLADDSGWVYDYHRSSKCNIHFFETIRRAGYKAKIIKRARGWGYPAFTKGPRSLEKLVRSKNLDWGIRLTGQPKDKIQAVIDSGVPCGLMNARHVVLLTKIIDIKYTAEGKVKTVSFKGYDQNRYEERTWRWNGAGALEIEIVQCIPDGTKPPYKNPLGAPQKPEAVVKAIAAIEDKKAEQGKSAPKPNEDRRDIAARRSWIRELRAEGLHYYADDPKIRNVFYKNLEFHVSSSSLDQQIPLYGKDIVCSAVSISFGHRITPQKLLSQDTYTWQFLGAGNKTGTLVFTFSGESGRDSADRIKRLIFRARENARQFQGLIPEAGSMKLVIDNPNNGESRNSMLALMNMEYIVVTDFSESNVPGTTDQHQLVINFVSQDFAEEKLDRNIVTSFDQKKRVIRALMGLLTHIDVDYVQENLIFKDEKKTKRWIIPSPQYVINRGRDAQVEQKWQNHMGTYSGAVSNGEGRHWRINPNSDIPGWLAEILVETANACTKANSEAPSVSDVRERVSYFFESWGAGHLIIGNPDETETYTESQTGAVETEWAAEGGGFHEAVDILDTEDKWSRVYMQWLNKMDVIFQKVMKHASVSDFGKWFGSIGEETINALTERIGECYDDMMLPDVPSGNIPLPPEFYVYDDAHEDPAVSSLTNDDNMEQFLSRHVRNSRASVKHYIEDTLLGGSYVSRNLPRIMDDRREYLNNFAGEGRDSGEFKFMSFGSRLAEGTKAWEPVFYRSAEDSYSKENTKKWMDRVADGKSAEESQFKFMNDILTLSPYLKEGRGERWNQPYNQSNEAELVETIYDDNWKKLSFGPNPNYKQADEVLTGTIPNTRSQAAATAVTKTPDQIKAERALKQGQEMTGNHTILKDGSVAFGHNAAEVQAAYDERVNAMIADDLNSFTSLMGTLFELTTVGMITNLIVNAVEEDNEEERLDALQTEMSKVLPDLDHTSVGNQFSQTKEEVTMARMAKGIGFGTKAKDLSIRRAYPTFKIYFIEDDEQGSEVLSGKMVRAFDDFYSYSAVQEIRVIRSRKVAADLAIIRITNVGGKLLRRRFGETSQYQQDLEAKHGINAEYETGVFADTELENPFEKMVLQDGVKVQIRLGYASNPDHLESVFLGSIVEISPSDDGKILELVCQGFGAELEGVELGPLEDGPIFYSSQQVLSGAIIQDSIVNFGRRGKYNRFTPGESRHSFTGGEGRGVFSSMSPAQLLRSWGESRLYKHYFKYPFRNYPQDDNIFAPPPHVYASTWQRFWNNACTYRPLKQTPWQVFKEHELRHPGYVSLAVPYGHSPRMTMFFGSKSQHYWAQPPSGLELFLAESATEQIIRLRGMNASKVANPKFAEEMVKLSKEEPGLAKAIINGVSTFSRATDVSLELGKMFGRYRPFRNFHYFDSKHHILRNKIRTSRDGTFNEVEVLYFEDENDIEEDDPLDLHENMERLTMGEAGVLACKLDENIPEEYIRSYREEFPSCVTEDMARRYIQGLFARLLRDSYKGELYVLGEPTLKPYDVCYLNDASINMTGPIEVEQVEHIINRDFGYVSIVTPDLCVDINDYYSASTLDLAGASLAYTFGLDDADTAISMAALASPLGFLAWTGGVKFLKWTQEGVPVVSTPLVLEGKPFMSVSLGQKRTSLFLSIHGRWRQYWDDLHNAWDKFDMAETMFDTKLSWSESVIGFIGGVSDAGDSIPLANED